MIVMGVDVSVKHRVAFADTTGRADSVMVHAGKGGDELYDLARQIGVFTHQFVNGRQISMVCVETPMGTHPNPALVMAAGVVTAAVYGQLKREYGAAVMVAPMNISTWKKRSVGFGNASKDQVAAWCRAQGHEFANQDECDAYGIAVAGLSMIDVQAA